MTPDEWITCSNLWTLLAFVAGKDALTGKIIAPVGMSERKLRLFLVACCRRHWNLFLDPECQRSVEVAERFADGLAGESELAAMEQSALALRDRIMEEMNAPTWTGSHHDGLMAFQTADVSSAVCWSLAQLKREQLPLGRSPDFVPTHPRHRRIWAGYVPYRVAEAVAYAVQHNLGEKGSAWEVHIEACEEENRAQIALLGCMIGDPFRCVSSEPTWFTPSVLAIAQAIYKERVFTDMPVLADALEDAGCTNSDFLNHCRQSGDHARGCWVLDCLLNKK